ncbi:hypothetical protein PUN4_550070 [Paraburkholderia unamae]|nr:hypothetical protein PUN4_550070 [Paraburkholderia unamae]
MGNCKALQRGEANGRWVMSAKRDSGEPGCKSGHDGIAISRLKGRSHVINRTARAGALSAIAVKRHRIR